MLTAECTTSRPLLGSARWEWWDWWLDRKTRWVRDEEKQLDEGVFRTLAAGTGLPVIHQRSTFPFKDVRDGADRFLGMAKGGERPYARIYTRLGNPTTEYLERVLFQLEAHHVIEKALAVDEKEPTIGALIFGSGMGAISTLALAVCRAGDAVLAGNVYGCTDSLFRGLGKFGVEAVFSTEPLRYPTSEPACELPAGGPAGLNCAGFGSVVTVTACVGMFAAARALNALAAAR